MNRELVSTIEQEVDPLGELRRCGNTCAQRAVRRKAKKEGKA